MHPNVQYLAEEVAENHRDGLLTRREAMKRLAYLGLGPIGAAALLAACGQSGKKASQSTTTAGGSGRTAQGTAPSGPATTVAPLPTQDISYAGLSAGDTVMGAFAPASAPRGAVLVIHENTGLSSFVRTMTGRLAGSGYSALAVDLLSKQGGTAAVTDTSTISGILGQNATSGRSVEDMKASLQELQRRVPGQKLAAIGFCFGGNMTWDLLAAGDPPPLSAAVPFYGQASNTDFRNTKAAVLAVYAGDDSRVNANQPTATGALKASGRTFDTRTFPGVGHAFMRMIDDPASGNGYTQATAAYQAMMDWFGTYLR